MPNYASCYNCTWYDTEDGCISPEYESNFIPWEEICEYWEVSESAEKI